MSSEPEDPPLFPKFNEFSQNSFCSFGNKIFCDFNQANDCLSDRFNENENDYVITSSSRNDNSVESNQKTGNFCKGEISTLNKNIFKEIKSTDLQTHKIFEIYRNKAIEQLWFKVDISPLQKFPVF